MKKETRVKSNVQHSLALKSIQENVHYLLDGTDKGRERE